MVDIDIDDMSCQIAHEVEPAHVAASEILDQHPIDGIVLIVVMRDQRKCPLMADSLVIGIEVPEMAPTIFIADLPSLEERIRPCNDGIDQGQAVAIVIAGLRCEVTDRL